MFIATTTICDDDERDERVDDLERERERERERVLSRSECESERAFSFFLELSLIHISEPTRQY